MEQQNNNTADSDIEAIENELAEQQRATKAHKAKAKTKAKTKSKGNGVAWLAVLLALMALGGLGGGYYLWQQQQGAEQQKLADWIKAQAGEQQKLVQQLTSQLKTLQAQQMKAQSGVKDQLFARVDAVEGRVNEVAGRQPNDWVLAEANYLIRIAGRKLWLEDDLITSQHLLATADVRIAELNDPSLIPLRKVISEDIAQIRALPNPAVTDIHLALSALIKMVETLPINTLEIHTEADSQNKLTPKDNAISASPADFKENFFKAVDDFYSRLMFVDYGVSESDIEPLKMPRQQWYLRANLKMKLLQAQVAVLNREQAVFRDSLDTALTWLKHFKAQDAQVVMMQTSLKDMLSYQIDAQYPEQFASQKVMDELLQSRLGNAYQIRQQAQAIVSQPEPQPKPQPELLKAEPVKAEPVKAQSVQPVEQQQGDDL